MSKSLLPPNATPLEQATETSMALAFDLPVEIDKLWSADTCPAPLLPYLAWALSVDTWDTDWPETVKRQTVASAVYVHRYKGTPAGIKAALNALDLGVTISEWFEHGSEPYTFRADLRLYNRPLSASEITLIHRTIAQTKNARSHLEALRIFISAKSSRSVSVVAKSGVHIIAVPPKPEAHLIRTVSVIATASVRMVAGDAS